MTALRLLGAYAFCAFLLLVLLIVPFSPEEQDALAGHL